MSGKTPYEHLREQSVSNLQETEEIASKKKKPEEVAHGGSTVVGAPHVGSYGDASDRTKDLPNTLPGLMAYEDEATAVIASLNADGTAAQIRHQRAFLEKQRMLLQGKIQAINAKVTELKHTAPVASKARKTSDLGLMEMCLVRTRSSNTLN